MASIKQIPRRKFDLRAQISNALTSFKHQTVGDWKVVPNRALMARVVQDYNLKRLYVSGSKFEPWPGTLNEVLSYVSVFDPVETECRPFSSLIHTPVFWLERPPRIANGRSFFIQSNLVDMIAGYDRSEAEHKKLEDHHPNTIGWDKFHSGLNPGKIIEAVFDVFNSLLRQYPLQAAWIKLLEILATENYKQLQPTYVYAALMHILVRGVACSSTIYVSARWRKNRSQKELKNLHDRLLSGEYMTELASQYKCETMLHADMINTEMGRLRFSNPRHDRTKFYPSMIYYYMWRWGIWEQFSEVNRHRLLSGYDIIENMEYGRFTVLEGIGETIGSGVANAMEAKLRDHSDEIRETVKGASSIISEEVGAACEKTLKSSMSEFFEKATVWSKESAAAFAEKAKGVLGSLPTSFSDMTSIFDSLSSFAKNVVEQVKGTFSAFFPREFSLNSTSILNALKYFVLFNNVENSFLKMILFMLILNEFGILYKGYEYILSIVSHLGHKVDDDVGSFTSGESWLSSIFSSAKSVTYIVYGVFASLISGRALSKLELGSLLATVAKNMRNFHFIGGGLRGLVYIFDFVKKGWTVLISWIKEKIFKITDIKKKLAKDVLAWLLKVKYFSTEAGMNAIRANVAVRDEAAALFARGQALLLEVSPSSPNYIQQCYRDIQMVWRDVKIIDNYTTRLIAMSTFVPTMFHIQLVGKPGIGKSTLTKTLTQKLNSSLFPEQKDSFWSYNPNLDHFDGYSGQKIMLVDDIFRHNEPKHMTTLIGLITNVPVTLSMANLEDKGCQMTSEIMISSTNVAYPETKDVYCTEAIYRRRHMLVEVVMDERVKDRASGAFSLKLFKKFYPDSDPSAFPHLTFNLMKPVPNRRDIVEYEEQDKDWLEKQRKLIAKLREVNQMFISDEDHVLPDFVKFKNSKEVPNGISFPCTGWNFDRFLLNAIGRFREMRKSEANYSPFSRYQKTSSNLAEIDLLLAQDDCFDGPALPRIQMLERLFDMSDIPENEEIDEATVNGESVFSELNNSTPGTTFDVIADVHATSSDSSVDIIEFPLDQEISLDNEEGIKFGNFTSDEPNDYEREVIRRRRLRRFNQEGVRETTWSPPRETVIDGKRYIHLDVTSFPDIVFPYVTANMDHEKHPIMKHMIKDNEIYQVVVSTLEADGEIEISTDSLQELNRNFKHAMYSANMIIPKHPAFPEDQWGKKTDLPIHLLQRCFTHDCEAVLFEIGNLCYRRVNFSDWIRYTPLAKPEIWQRNCAVASQMFKTPRSQLQFEGSVVDVPITAGLLWILNPWTVRFANALDCYTPEQKKVLIEDAKRRMRLTGWYTPEAYAEFANNIVAKKFFQTISFLTSGLDHIYDRSPSLIPALMGIVAFAGVYLLIKSMAGLFFGTKPTSKYLHRGPVSAIQLKGRFSSSTVGKPLEQSVASLLRRNCREIIFQNQDGLSARSQSLCTEQFVIFNKHSLLRFKPEDSMTISIMSPDGKDEWMYPIDWSSIYADPNGDLAILHSKHLPFGREISSYLLSQEAYDRLEINQGLIFLSRNSDGVAVSQHQFLTKVQNIQLKDVVMDRAFLVRGSTIVGKSGSPVILPTQVNGNFSILGIQAWEIGTIFDSKIAVQVLTKEKFQNLLDELQKKLSEQIIIREDDFEDMYVPAEELGAFTSQEFNNVVATVPKHMSLGIVGKTQFKKTPLADFMDLDGQGSQSVPAALNPFDENLVFGTKIHPLKNSIDKYFKGTIEPFDQNLLEYIKQNLISFFKSRLDKQNFRRLTLEEAITGTREDGSNPMALNTSPGIPYVFQKRTKKGKRDYFEISETGELDFIDDQIIEDMIQFESSLRRGVLPLTCSYDFPKDELRPVKKAYGSIEDGTPPKTRSVTCMDMKYCLLWRMYTLDMWASFHRCADGTFPLCPGINPEGPEWSNAYFYLNRHPHCLDFDVSNWDGFLPSQISFLVGDIISELNGFEIGSPDHLVIRSIITELVHGYIQHGRVVYQKSRGMISGFPGTAEVNTIVHYILINYIYLLLVKDYPSFATFQCFNDSVSCLIYGDDIILSISDELLPLFNGESISKMYRKIGYPVTSATKEQDIPMRKELSECSFLKSTWVPLTQSIYIRKMDISVVRNLMYWVRAGEHPITQMFDNLVDAARIVFGYGKPYYEKWRSKLNFYLGKCDLPPLLFSYDDLYYDHMRRYYVEC